MSLKLAKKSSKSLLIIEDYVMTNEKVKVELTPEEVWTLIDALSMAHYQYYQEAQDETLLDYVKERKYELADMHYELYNRMLQIGYRVPSKFRKQN